MSIFRHQLNIAAPVEQVYAAIATPHRLARWWGPAGFTNSFHQCDFQVGGQWSYTMHGPDGRRYKNESTFEVIEAPRFIVIRHISEPKYRLSIELTQAEASTLVDWVQEFDSTHMAEKLAHIVAPSNDENLARLAIEVLHHT